jgi:O-antigen/teichoic acid export membrane protein
VAIISARFGGYPYSLADQIFSVGTIFIANIILARTATTSEYGAFAIIYTVYTLITAMHNAYLMEPFTLFASGLYRKDFTEYLQYAIRINYMICMALSFLTFGTFIFLFTMDDDEYYTVVFGLAIALTSSLTAIFSRRVFYIDKNTRLAAKMSFYFFSIVIFGLMVLVNTKLLSGFSIFILIGLGWLIAMSIFYKKYSIGFKNNNFISYHPNYWKKHWTYSRWVIATALIFQLSSQGYLWIVGGILSLNEVASLRALLNITQPINILFGAISMVSIIRLSKVFQDKDYYKFEAILIKVLTCLLILSIIFYILVLMFDEKIIKFLYSGKYLNSLEFLKIVGVAPVVFGVGALLNDALKAMEEPKWTFYSYLASGSVTLAIGIPLIYKLGLEGAAWGILISSVTFATVGVFGFYISSKKLFV